MVEKRWLPCCTFPLVLGMLSLCAVVLIFMPDERHPVAGMDVPPSETAVPHEDTGAIRVLDRTFDAAAIARGRATYMQYCAACHGANGEGQFPDAPLAPDATGRIGAPPHNETGHSWHHSDTLLVRYVTEGGFADPTRFYTMPTFGDVLNEAQAMQVIAYIKTLWTDEQRAMQRQLTEEEAALFND